MEITNVIDELFETETMRKHLKENLDKIDLKTRIALIGGSRATLERKAEIFEALAQENDVSKGSIVYLMGAMLARTALSELVLKEGELFVVNTFEEYDRGMSLDNTTVFTKIEAVKEYIIQDSQHMDDTSALWYSIEKWALDKKCKYVCKFKFTAFPDGNIVFYDSMGDDRFKGDFDYCFSRSDNLNLPLPFKEGDCVSLDLRPFVHGVKHIKICSTYKADGCCGVKYSYVDRHGEVGEYYPLKHISSFKAFCGNSTLIYISGLYRAEIYNGELAENEKKLFAEEGDKNDDN